MTDAERNLWSKLRLKQLEGFRFQRQRIIGDYIVDFYCAKAKIIIEVDGSQHYSDEKVVKADEIRDKYLRNLGLKVLRFTDTDALKNIEGVVENILENLKTGR